MIAPNVLGPPPVASWADHELRKAMQSERVALNRNWSILDASTAQAHGIGLLQGEVGALCSRVSASRGFGLEEGAFELLCAMQDPLLLDLSEEPATTVRELANLIVKGILDYNPVSTNDADQSPTGWEAFLNELPCWSEFKALTPASRNALLTEQAVCHGLDWNEILGAELADALYDFGRAPGYVIDQSEFTQIIEAVDNIDGLKRNSSASYWISWSNEKLSQQRQSRGPKLFLSPCNPVEGICAAAAALRGIPVSGLKIPADSDALARPDSCVLYFADSLGLTEAIEALSPALTGLSGRGLPFAAPIDTQGLLSWGEDQFSGGQSHRLYLSQLAAAHIDAVAASASHRQTNAIELDDVTWRLAVEGYAHLGCQPLEGITDGH